MQKKAAILDDDKVFARLLCEKIQALFDKYSLDFSIDVFTSADELAESGTVYQLFFMDVVMPEKDGITVIREYRALGMVEDVIFVSAHEGQVFEIFESTPVSFVRKGHLDEDLEKAVSLYRNRVSSSRVAIREGTKTHIFEADEILYLVSSSHYIDLHMRNGNRIVLRGKMDEMERVLDGHGFARIHISYLVNLNYVMTVRRQHLQLRNGELFKISAKYRNSLEERLGLGSTAGKNDKIL